MSGKISTAEMMVSLEAQFVMGHIVASGHMTEDRRFFRHYSWDVDQVRIALHVPKDSLWEERVLALEQQGLATFCYFCAPVTYDEYGVAHTIEDWQDQPREDWGSLSIYAHGVLRLATLYKRPYVRLTESPAIVAHWELVQEEAAARLTYVNDPDYERRWAEEWPERAMMWRAEQRELNNEAYEE